MTAATELLDAGDGRRLERFGDLVVDRPGARRRRAAARSGRVAARGPRLRRATAAGQARRRGPDRWEVDDGDLRFELRPTPTGQVGLFPEQARTAPGSATVIGSCPARTAPAVLNLFAYTGAMTLSAAAAGASVTHVDGSRPAVGWARRNAELSGLADRPDPLDRRRCRGVRGAGGPPRAALRRRSSSTRRATGTVPAVDRGGSRSACPELLAACAALTGDAAGVRRPDRAHARASGRVGWRTSWRSRSGRRASDVDAGTLGLRAPERRAPAPRCVRAHHRADDGPRRRSRASPNPRVKAAVRLRDRRERETTGLTIVDGARELSRALDAGIEVEEAFVCDAPRSAPTRRGTSSAGSPASVGLTSVSEPVIAKLAFGDRSDGVVAIVRTPPTGLDRAVARRDAARRRRRGGREARQSRCDPPDGRWRRRRRRHRRGPADGPLQPERDPGEPRHDLHPAAGCGAVGGRSGRGSRARPPRRRGAGRRRTRPTRTPTSAAPVAIVLGSEAEGLRVRVGRRARRAGPDPDARRRRQPERVGRGRGPPLRGRPAAQAAAPA